MADSLKALISSALGEISTLEDFVTANKIMCSSVKDDTQAQSIILSSIEAATKATLTKIDGIKKSIDKVDNKIYKQYVQPDVDRVSNYVVKILNDYNPRDIITIIWERPNGVKIYHKERSKEELKDRWEKGMPVEPLSPGGA